MSRHGENRKITGVTMRNISSDEQQTVISFRSSLESEEDELKEIYEALLSIILSERDVIIVTKEDQIMDLLSDVVETADRNHVCANALKVASFVPQPESNVKHNATLVNTLPLSVAKDLGTCTEFIYGNLWFLIDAGVNQTTEHVISDIRKLTLSAFNELPSLRHEAVAAPAMYDGLEILWFNPKQDVYKNLIKPLFED